MLCVALRCVLRLCVACVLCVAFVLCDRDRLCCPVLIRAHAIGTQEYIHTYQKKREGTNLNPNADVEEERHCVGSLLASEKDR